MFRPITGRLNRELQKEPSPAADLLWPFLCNRKFRGWEFERQYPIVSGDMNGNHVSLADFYCEEKTLIIQIDGDLSDDQRRINNQRDHILTMFGYRIVRLNEKDVFENPERSLRYVMP